MLLSAHRFCYSHRIPSQGELSDSSLQSDSPAIFTIRSASSFQDDRYFLSGSLDGKLRLWNIPDKKVALWNEVDGQTRLITAANFCQNGKYAVIGTYDGRCIFYDTEVLSSVDLVCPYFLLFPGFSKCLFFFSSPCSSAPEISHSNSREVHQREE